MIKVILLPRNKSDKVLLLERLSCCFFVVNIWLLACFDKLSGGEIFSEKCIAFSEKNITFAKEMTAALA